MKGNVTDLDQRQLLHRRVWQKKSSIRLLYRDDNCSMPAVKVRCWISEAEPLTSRTVRPDIISTDILSFPGIDVVADAYGLPFSDSSFAGIIMLDVLLSSRRHRGC
jgi:hypothetical protein